MPKHKHVSSYHVSHAWSGIITLVINTHERWVPFHRADHHLYLFGDSEVSEEEDYFAVPEDELVIPSLSISAEVQDKDQICIYFIPFELLTEAKESI